MIRTLSRVLLGFLVACLTAGLLQVLFALPPGPILAAPASEFATRAGRVVDLALLSATHAAIFSALFALIAVSVGEWTKTRSVGYYLFAGVVIALLGFAAQFASEAPGTPTILNNYALKTFLTSGFFAGFAYWLVAGRSAGGRAYDVMATADGDGETIGVPPPAKTWKNRPKLIIEDAPKPGSKDARKASLSDRLAEQEADLIAAKSAAKDVARVTRPDDRRADNATDQKLATSEKPEGGDSAAVASRADVQGAGITRTSVPTTKNGVKTQN